MKYAIEIALNRIIPKEIKSIIATQRTLDILIDGVTENFVVIPMDEMLEVYKEQENLFDYDVIPGLSNESRLKLKRVTPDTLAQAERIDGVRPSELALLQVHLTRQKYGIHKPAASSNMQPETNENI